jgi:methionyl aminopeptidase
VTTAELDRIAEDEIRRLGGEPSFKGYGAGKNKFPSSLCTSVNSVIVHGVPSRYALKAGDIVGLDLGVRYKGFYTDAAVTVPVGSVSPEAMKLLRVTEESLGLAIMEACPGNHIGDISHAMQTAAERAGFNVVRDLIGHGVGYAVHEEPNIPCHGRAGQGVEIQAGMVFAIEPMVVTGSWRTATEPGEWPVITEDGGLAAHFEHTVIIGPDGPEIVTQAP